MSSSLKNYAGDEIAQALAGRLEDKGFTNLFKKADDATVPTVVSDDPIAGIPPLRMEEIGHKDTGAVPQEVDPEEAPAEKGLPADDEMCGCDADDEMCVCDPQTAVAVNFANKHLSKIASALDAAGFVTMADEIDGLMGKFAAKKGDGKPGRSLSEWVSSLKKNNAPKDVIDAFKERYKGALKSAKKDGKKDAEEYAMRTAVDKLPKKYLKEPTSVHGPEKSGKKTK